MFWSVPKNVRFFDDVLRLFRYFDFFIRIWIFWSCSELFETFELWQQNQIRSQKMKFSENRNKQFFEKSRRPFFERFWIFWRVSKKIHVSSGMFKNIPSDWLLFLRDFHFLTEFRGFEAFKLFEAFHKFFVWKFQKIFLITVFDIYWNCWQVLEIFLGFYKRIWWWDNRSGGEISRSGDDIWPWDKPIWWWDLAVRQVDIEVK